MAVLSFILASGAALVLSCSATAPSKSPQWSRSEISTPASVAGMWAGVMIRSPAARYQDWVRLFIREDGSFEFRSYRPTGVFSGKGKFIETSGELLAQADRGNVRCSLYTTDDQRLLRVLGKATNGIEYSAELSPER
jgi:hypothetical protein